MSSKTISIKESTYDRLKALKGPEESFSDAIDRLVGVREGGHPLFDLVGLLDDEELEEVAVRSNDFREAVDDRMNADQ